MLATSISNIKNMEQENHWLRVSRFKYF